MAFAQQGLDFVLRKKFEDMVFSDLYELSVRASKYKGLLKEEREKRAPVFGTYYQNTLNTEEINVTEFIYEDPKVCDVLTNKNGKALKLLKNAKEGHYSFDIA